MNKLKNVIHAKRLEVENHVFISLGEERYCDKVHHPFMRKVLEIYRDIKDMPKYNKKQFAATL